MSLHSDLQQELQRLQGFSGPQTTSASVSGPGGLTLLVDFFAVDSIGCSIDQIVLDVPALNNAAFDVLRTWAQALSQRITYLMEQIGPLEYDEVAGEVLMRSVSPAQLPDGAQYYEILLQSRSGGRFVLRRYASIKGQPGRTAVPIETTRQVLLRLADDLVDTLPAATP